MTTTSHIDRIREALEAVEAKADEARAYLTSRPANKPKCNIILLQIAQGKFTANARQSFSSLEASLKGEQPLGCYEAFAGWCKAARIDPSIYQGFRDCWESAWRARSQRENQRKSGNAEQLPPAGDVERMLKLLKRYRSETPLGHQPHMIAHEADEIIAAMQDSGSGKALSKSTEQEELVIAPEAAGLETRCDWPAPANITQADVDETIDAVVKAIHGSAPERSGETRCSRAPTAGESNRSHPSHE